jgi:hypothetical protein
MSAELKGETIIRSPNLYGDPQTVLRYVSAVAPACKRANTFP